MPKKYVAANGRSIPGGWPDDGRPIDELSKFHRRLIKDGDLIPQPVSEATAKPVKKKETSNDD